MTQTKCRSPEESGTRSKQEFLSICHKEQNKYRLNAGVCSALSAAIKVALSGPLHGSQPMNRPCDLAYAGESIVEMRDPLHPRDRCDVSN
jgi:hypothetical protein